MTWVPVCVIKLASPLSDPISTGYPTELFDDLPELLMRALLFSLLLDSNVDNRFAALSL